MYIYIYIYICVHIGAPVNAVAFNLITNSLVFFRDSEGGKDTVGNPHRAQIPQFELFELKCLNSSFSSLSSY